MGITLPPDVEKRIEDLTRSGGYGSAADLLVQALDMIEAAITLESGDRAFLRQQISEGLESIRRGDVVEAEGVLEEIDSLVSQAEQRVRGKTAP